MQTLLISKIVRTGLVYPKRNKHRAEFLHFLTTTIFLLAQIILEEMEATLLASPAVWRLSVEKSRLNLDHIQMDVILLSLKHCVACGAAPLYTLMFLFVVSEIPSSLEAGKSRIGNDVKLEEFLHLRDFVFCTKTEPFHWYVSAFMNYQTLMDTSNQTNTLKNGSCHRRGDAEGANSTVAWLQPESNINNISTSNYSYKISRMLCGKIKTDGRPPM